MFCQYEGADADKHDECRDDDAVFVGCYHLFTIGIFILATLGHEDGVVITLTEDEGCEYHIHNVKFYAKQCHDSQNPYPTHRHGQE